MSYQSVNSREILVPELGITLHLHSIELPGSIAQLPQGQHSEDVDRALAHVCQEIFRVGPTEVVSFSDWLNTTNQIRKLMDFYHTEYAANTNYQVAREKIGAVNNAFKKPGQYLESLIINGLLAPRQQRLGDASLEWLERTATDGKLGPRFFGDLATTGISELGFTNWYQINQFLSAQEYPSSKNARSEVPEFEIPFAGSKPLKAITIQNFEKLCYGAAATVVGQTALAATSAIGHGQPPALIAVLGGSVSALLLVSVGSLSRFLEDFLKSKSTLKETPSSTKSTSKPRAAAAA